MASCINYKDAADMNGCGRLYYFEGTLTVQFGDDISTLSNSDCNNYCINAATGEKLSFCRDEMRARLGGLCQHWKRDSEIDFDG